MPANFAVRPVRQERKGHGPWLPCQPHRAQQWAVCELRANGTIRTQLNRYATHDLAKQMLHGLLKALMHEQQRKRQPKPGGRASPSFTPLRDQSLLDDDRFLRSL